MFCALGRLGEQCSFLRRASRLDIDCCLLSQAKMAVKSVLIVHLSCLSLLTSCSCSRAKLSWMPSCGMLAWRLGVSWRFTSTAGRRQSKRLDWLWPMLGQLLNRRAGEVWGRRCGTSTNGNSPRPARRCDRPATWLESRRRWTSKAGQRGCLVLQAQRKRAQLLRQAPPVAGGGFAKGQQVRQAVARC